MYYSYVEIEYIATSFSPARTDLALKLLTKSCKSCQIKKRRSQKYGHLPPKIVYTIPWECLCVDLIGPYTLKGKDNLQIDFMALTMIDPASVQDC